MLKKALVVLVFALIVVPTAAMAQTFTGTVSHMVIKNGAMDNQAYSQTKMVIQGVDGTIGWDTNNLTLTMNDSGNGYATVVGDLTFMFNNVSLQTFWFQPSENNTKATCPLPAHSIHMTPQAMPIPTPSAPPAKYGSY